MHFDELSLTLSCSCTELSLHLFTSVRQLFTLPRLRSAEIMVDPVSTVDGHTYERSAILRWFERSGKSPLTGLQLGSKALVPNIAMRKSIRGYLEKGPELGRRDQARPGFECNQPQVLVSEVLLLLA